MTLDATSFSLDPDAFTFRFDGRDIPLTRTEFHLLQFLMQESGRVVSRDRIVDAVWSERKPSNHRTIDFHVHGLRKAFRKAHMPFDPVRVVRGVGYAFNRRPQQMSAD